MNPGKIAIVGGGIGGLTLAVALQRKGFDVIVYEAAPEIKPLGAGLGLAANAVNAFAEIGIRDEILKAGKILKILRIKNEYGKVLTETDSEKITAKFGVINNFTIHRADLHQVLLEHLKPGTIELSKQCIDIVTQGAGTQLKFSDGTSAYAGVVVACDGVRSVIRKKLLPESQPRFAGYTCWRGVTDALPSSIDLDETSETWGRGTRFGIVPLSKNRVYWFACVNAKANDQQLKHYSVQDLLRIFGTFHAPVPELLQHTDPAKIIWSDIIDIKPIKRFAFDNILLMGDAAHATTPNMGQGACMAIEDAAVLANCLSTCRSTSEAFQQFEAKRISRTTTIVNNSWNIGKIAQLENKALIFLRNTAIRFTPASVTEKQIRFLTEISFN